VATYKSSSVEVPAPELPPLRREAAGRPGPVVGDDELAAVLLDVVEAWISGSNARAEVSISESVDEAIGNLGVDSFWMGDITAEQGMALIAWAGASGGAHGRRRGAAAGRSAAWWAASALTDLEWPPDPAELGEAIRELRWYRWEPKALAGGWHLHLAVASPDGDWVAALAVEDRAE
jgi:hypothetical protein